MANRVLEFLLQTKKQGDAVAQITEESKELADTLRNKVTLAMSEADQASRKLAAAQERLAASSDPEEQAKLTHEINKARVAMDNAQAKADKYSDELNGVGLASKEAGDAQSGMGLSLTDLKSGLDLVTQGAEVLGQVFDATVGKAADWGDSMGDLAAITGATTEQTSLMVAAFELVDVGVGSIESAIKAMTKNGLTPNLETMKELALQYQAIQDPVEKNKFLFENFGKAGLDLAEIMGSDVETLERLENAARSSGKVIGDDVANASAEYNIQAAIMQQRVEGLAISIGNTLIPAVNEYLTLLEENHEELVAITGQLVTTTATYEEYVAGVQRAEIAHGNLSPSTNALIASGRLMTEQMFNAARATAMWNDTTAEAEREARRFASAQVDIEKPVMTAEEALAAQREELRLNSDQVERLGNLMGGAVGNELRSFADSQTELKDKAEEYKLKIEELQEKPYLTAAQKQELEDTKTKLGDVNTALEENATAHEIATKRILFSILQQQAASDGFTTTEVAGLTDIATKWGLVDEATANATKEMSGALEDLSKDGNLDDFNTKVDTTLGKLLGWPTDLTTTFNFVSNGSIPNPGAGDIGLPGGDSGVYNPTPGQEITPVGGAYALGGSTVLPGSGSTDQPYLIRATPGEHVQFTPPGQAPSGGGGGGDIHIHIGSVNSSNQNDVDMLLQKLGAAVRQAMQGGHAFVGAR